MRMNALSGCAAMLLGLMTLGPAPAHAVPLAAPAALDGAREAADVTKKINCRLVWRCGPWGCGWREVCWAPPPYYYYGGGPYWGWGGPVRPWGWGYRPVVRPWGWGYRPVVRPWGWGAGPYWARPRRVWVY